MPTMTAVFGAGLTSSMAGLFAILAAVAFWQRCTRRNKFDRDSSKGVTETSIAPGALPIIGHIGGFAINQDKLLRGARDGSDHGLFAVNLFGTVFNMVHAPSLFSTVFAQRASVLEFNSIVWRILELVGGIPAKWKPTFYGAFHELEQAVISHMMREPALGLMVDSYMRHYQEQLPHLVSFLPRAIDHSIWEREANAEFISKADSREPIMEADLLPLILQFIGAASQPSLVGTDFASKNPDFLHDMFQFNKIFLLLAAGVPSWLPIPGLSGGVAARRRIIKAMTELEEALAAEEDGEALPHGFDDISDVSKVIRIRASICRKHKLPAHIAAACDISLVWALHANSNFAVYWMMLRILNDSSGLIDALRKEISPFVTCVRDDMRGFSNVQVTPDITIDHRGLSNSCPLLKACFIETLRLDSAPWSLRKASQDFKVTETKTDAARFQGTQEAAPRTWALHKGEFVAVPFDLHFTDPKFYAEPAVFRPERHIVASTEITSEEIRTAEWGHIRPFGGGASMCKGRMFAEREVLAAVAGLLHFWNFEPVTGDWHLPKGTKATGVNMPKSDVRVRITKRKEGWS